MSIYVVFKNIRTSCFIQNWLWTWLFYACVGCARSQDMFCEGSDSWKEMQVEPWVWRVRFYLAERKGVECELFPVHLQGYSHQRHAWDGWIGPDYDAHRTWFNPQLQWDSHVTLVDGSKAWTYNRIISSVCTMWHTYQLVNVDILEAYPSSGIIATFIESKSNLQQSSPSPTHKVISNEVAASSEGWNDFIKAYYRISGIVAYWRCLRGSFHH